MKRSHVRYSIGPAFQRALNRVIKEHGLTNQALHALLKRSVHVSTIRKWRAGKLLPRWTTGRTALFELERYCNLEPGYFARMVALSAQGYQERLSKLGPFACALTREMHKHGDTSQTLASAIELRAFPVDFRVIRDWANCSKLPRHRRSFVILQRIENHYGLPTDYFAQLLAPPETLLAQAFKAVPTSEKNTLRWHLPTNFERLAEEKQREILGWISTNVLPKTTEFGKWQQRVGSRQFSLMFPSLDQAVGGRKPTGYQIEGGMQIEARGSYGNVAATERLTAELTDLISFKTSTLPPAGYHRLNRWKPVTATMFTRNYGFLFGALAAAPLSDVGGLGLPTKDLTFALLAFPAIWDWYLSWREHRRGFLTISERNILYEGRGLVRDWTGWIRQHPEFARRLRPIEGLLSKRDIIVAKRNWPAACERTYRYLCHRIRAVRRVERVHRDPFEPISVVLNSASPLSEYKKIADEIIRLMPNEKLFPLKAATAVRAYLMVRLGIHTGLRQRNMRELLLCEPGVRPRTLQELQELEKGEIRWSEAERRWAIVIPANAFKNGRSRFFGGKPYRLVLPDIDNLYKYITAYVHRHRSILLGGYPPPATFFVRTFNSRRRSDPHDVSSYHDMWIDIIQKYGIYNPYTGKGAIRGLLPHGPHCVRDVIATHILKQTGSYELAGFALQDTTAAVMRHYSRFAPHEKAAMAAALLNPIWDKSRRSKAKLALMRNRPNGALPAESQLYPKGRQPNLSELSRLYGLAERC